MSNNMLTEARTSGDTLWEQLWTEEKSAATTNPTLWLTNCNDVQKHTTHTHRASLTMMDGDFDK